MGTIENNYKLKFENSVTSYPDFQMVSKTMYSDPQILSDFFLTWKVEELNELLLPDIEEALITPNCEIENGNELISILIYIDHVDFYDNRGDYSYTMPILDFKDVVIMWRDFLLEPPLNGTMIEEPKTREYKNWLTKAVPFFKREKT